MVRNGNDDEIKLSPKALITFMALLAGGNFASMYYTGIRTEPAVVRPDPFTGADGRILDAKIGETSRRIDMLEKRIDAIRADLNHCLDDAHPTDRSN